MSVPPPSPKPSVPSPAPKREATKTGSNPFTVDGTGSIVREMPSIDRLLNRRRSSGGTQISAPKDAEPAPAAVTTPQASAPEPEPDSPAFEIEFSPSGPRPADRQAGEAADLPELEEPSQFIEHRTPEASGVRDIVLDEPGSGFELESAGQLASGDPAASESAAAVAIAPPTQAPASIAASPAPAATAPISLRVQPAKRRRSETAKLIVWDLATLQRGADPLGRGLAHMIARGARSALFLAIAPSPSGSGAPVFLGTAAVAPGVRTPIWTGVRWDPTVVPEVWNFFVRTGYIELSAPGTSTNIRSNRNVIRAAFGVNGPEFLVLIRVGQPNACRGVIAVISDKSLLPDMEAVVALVSQAPPKAA